MGKFSVAVRKINLSRIFLVPNFVLVLLQLIKYGVPGIKAQKNIEVWRKFTQLTVRRHGTEKGGVNCLYSYSLYSEGVDEVSSGWKSAEAIVSGSPTLCPL